VVLHGRPLVVVEGFRFVVVVGFRFVVVGFRFVVAAGARLVVVFEPVVVFPFEVVPVRRGDLAGDPSATIRHPSEVFTSSTGRSDAVWPFAPDSVMAEALDPWTVIRPTARVG
jgi:hypothetical protein